MKGRLLICVFVWGVGTTGIRAATLFYDDFSDPARLKKTTRRSFKNSRGEG